MLRACQWILFLCQIAFLFVEVMDAANGTTRTHRASWLDVTLRVGLVLLLMGAGAFTQLSS